MPQAVLGLGSNLGARRALMRCALSLLTAQPGLTLLARSRLYETPPLGPPQPNYLNAAVRVAWQGTLQGLFQVCQRVEQLLGRERRERWGARTLDIDLLHWSEGAVHTPWLDVPHLELTKRPFALAPLLDVQPELESSYGALLANLGGAPELANPGWLELAHAPVDPARASPASVQFPAETPNDEIACLAASAVGACARTPGLARASLWFTSSERPLEHGASFFLERIQRLASCGFRAIDAAITAADATGTRGYLIGEHSGARESRLLPRVVLEPADGPTRTLWAFPPPGP